MFFTAFNGTTIEGRERINILHDIRFTIVNNIWDTCRGSPQWSRHCTPSCTGEVCRGQVEVKDVVLESR